MELNKRRIVDDSRMMMLRRFRRRSSTNQYQHRHHRHRPSSSSSMVVVVLRIATFLLLLLLLRDCVDASYTLTLQPDTPVCFSIRVPADKPTTLSGNFDCWEEGESHMRGCRNIAAWIEPSGRRKSYAKSDVWSSHRGASEETFSIQVDGRKDGIQKYNLCFESSRPERMGRHGRKVEDNYNDDSEPYELQLGFNIRVQPSGQRSLPNEEMGPDALRAVELLRAATDTEEQWQNLLDHFDFLRNREAIHRQLTGQINDRVMGWTLIEAVLVVTMAVGQVWYWKAFFEQRRYL